MHCWIKLRRHRWLYFRTWNKLKYRVCVSCGQVDKMFTTMVDKRNIQDTQILKEAAQRLREWKDSRAVLNEAVRYYNNGDV